MLQAGALNLAQVVPLRERLQTYVLDDVDVLIDPSGGRGAAANPGFFREHVEALCRLPGPRLDLDRVRGYLRAAVRLFAPAEREVRFKGCLGQESAPDTYPPSR